MTKECDNVKNKMETGGFVLKDFLVVVSTMFV